MKYLDDLPITPGAPVLVRASLNVPIQHGAVLGSFRVRATIPTIRTLSEHGAKVIVIGHIGSKGNETLAPVASFLTHTFPKLSFVPTNTGSTVYDAVRNMDPGDIILLENLRRNRGEVHNDSTFTRELSYADFFVQDAFDACHRSHASIIGVPKLLPSYAGLLLEQEITHLNGALSPKSLSLVIFGGAKFSTKIPALKALLPLYDRVFVGGAILHDLLLSRGFCIGKSLTSGNIDAVSDVKDNQKILIPRDVVVIGKDGKAVRTLENIEDDDIILDAGPETLTMLEQEIMNAKTVLWNGPLGNYERGFDEGDKAIIRALAKSNTCSIVGGGDTVASIEDMNLEQAISFISTGGGAMLEFLAKRTLPGINALS
jgi:phosphoglycerate kinase